jgi:RNA ligase (TIGR02306 family)
MSEYKVPLTKILTVRNHHNAHSLDIVTVYGFEIVTGRDQYVPGDLCIFVPPDSILPMDLETKLFGGPDSKIKLNKSRVKQIKIRGTYSQGLLIEPEIALQYLKDHQGLRSHINQSFFSLEKDYASVIGIVKYEPPAPSYQGPSLKRDKPKENSFFHVYGGIDNFKWYPDLFAEGEQVSITEKIHGSNIRFGMVPYVANNLYRKLLKFLGLTPKFEWVYGSNRVQLQQRKGYKGWYGENVYGNVLAKYNAKDKVQPDEIWYGELYGSGIQGNYNYGCKEGEHKLVVFDLKYQNGTDSYFASPDDFMTIAKERGFEVVPELYRGPYTSKVKLFTEGNSILAPEQKVREGVVIKPLVEDSTSIIGRKVLKLISEKYLEADPTDFH